MSRRASTGDPAIGNPHRPLQIVLLGDSLAYGAGDEARKGIAGRIESHLRALGVEESKATNRGVNGAQTAQLAARLKEPALRELVAGADVIVLSIGANDLFRTPGAQQRGLADPRSLAEPIVQRIESILGELRRINDHARVLVIGAYNPVPQHPFAGFVSELVDRWDAFLAARLASDRLVSVVRAADLVTADRLSHFDRFHPGSKAYEALSKRIAEMIVASLD